MDWVIFYSNGVFTSEDGDPWDAPRTDVQIIVHQHDDVGWEIVHSADFYYYEPERRYFYKADYFTMWDHLVRAKRPLVLFGRMASDEEYKAVFNKAKRFMDEPKSAWLKRERRCG